jgi:hypothetical protein
MVVLAEPGHAPAMCSEDCIQGRSIVNGCTHSLHRTVHLTGAVGVDATYKHKHHCPCVLRLQGVATAYLGFMGGVSTSVIDSINDTPMTIDLSHITGL